MRLSRTLVALGLAAVLAGYGVDCSAMATPMQMMQCCKTMPCGHHGDGQNCCQTMAFAHAPFVKASKIDAPHAPISAIAAISPRAPAAWTASAASGLVGVSHAPPISSPITSLSPLRI